MTEVRWRISLKGLNRQNTGKIIHVDIKIHKNFDERTVGESVSEPRAKILEERGE